MTPPPAPAFPGDTPESPTQKAGSAACKRTVPASPRPVWLSKVLPAPSPISEGLPYVSEAFLRSPPEVFHRIF